MSDSSAPSSSTPPSVGSAPKIAPMTKSQMVVRLASHPDEFQTHYSLPLSRMRLFCWTTYFQGYLKCNSVSNQFSSFYRDGTFSDCSDVWKNVTECFRISRLSSDDATLELTRIRLSRVNHTASVWPLRTNPAASWQFHDPDASSSSSSSSTTSTTTTTSSTTTTTPSSR